MHEEAAKKEETAEKTNIETHEDYWYEGHEVSHGNKDLVEWFQIKNWICVRCKRHINPSEESFNIQVLIILNVAVFGTLKVENSGIDYGCSSVIVIFNLWRTWFWISWQYRSFCWTLLWNGFWEEKKIVKKVLLVSLAIIQKNEYRWWGTRWLENGINVFADIEFGVLYWGMIPFLRGFGWWCSPERIFALSFACWNWNANVAIFCWFQICFLVQNAFDFAQNEWKLQSMCLPITNLLLKLFCGAALILEPQPIIPSCLYFPFFSNWWLGDSGVDL